jgi:hypothetical protein
MLKNTKNSVLWTSFSSGVPQQFEFKRVCTRLATDAITAMDLVQPCFALVISSAYAAVAC